MRRRAMRFLDVQSPFFRPLWLRVVTTAACIGWAIFELLTGGMFWAILFGAAGAYLAWQFFVAFDPPPDEDADDP